MKSFKVILFIVLFFSLSSNFASAGSTGLVSGPILKTKAYQRYLENKTNTRREIQYLIDLVNESELDFERNDTIFSGTKAAEHLELKFRFFGRKVKTAEDFIEQIASGSSVSGKHYYVVFPDDTRLPLKSVLLSELKRLRAS